MKYDHQSKHWLWDTEKYYRPPWLVKTIIFWPWSQPFNSFCFETLSFSHLPLFFLFSFCYAKKRGWRRGESYGLPGPLGVAGPGSKSSFFIFGLNNINSILLTFSKMFSSLSRLVKYQTIKNQFLRRIKNNHAFISYKCQNL